MRTNSSILRVSISILVLLRCYCLSLSAPKSSPPLETVDTVVIGGGVSGMVTAFYTNKGGARTLLAESSSNLGGVIDTDKKKGGYQWENGPNTFQASAKGMLRFASDLNLSIVASDPKLPKFILSSNDREIYAIPKELPKLLSLKGLFRAIGGLVLLPVASKDSSVDESIASFVSRVLGEEVLEKVVEPLISTIYTGDPSKMSLASVFPFLGDLAAAADDTPGGLLHCFVVSKKNADKKKMTECNKVDWNQVDAGKDIFPNKRNYGTLPDVPKGASLSFSEGLEALPNAVKDALGEDVCRLGWKAISIQHSSSSVENTGSDKESEKVPSKGEDSFDVCFETATGERRVVRTSTVVVATPPVVSASLLSSFSSSANNLPDNIQTPPVVAVTLAFSKSALSRTTKAVSKDDVDNSSTDDGLYGFGILAPRSAGLKTLGFQFISSLFPSRAPAGKEVVLAYVGGAQCPLDLNNLSDEELVSIVVDDAKSTFLSSSFSVKDAEVLSVHRWEKGIPQYGIDHSLIVNSVRSELPRTKFGGILLGGAGAGGGISLGDCAESGFANAETVLEMLRYRSVMNVARKELH